MDERANFFRLGVSRAPGKRQVKPTAAIFEEAAIDDDDDDEDFTADNNDSNLESEEEDEANSDEGSENEDDEDSDSSAEESQMNGGVAVEHKNEKEVVTESLICTICLNLRKATKGDEIIQCDKCGIAVHEACYGVEDSSDSQSVSSSSSTEPWFCEPCIFGLNTIPYCELCPNRYGAFKKSDIGDGWVHLLCALFTPGMSFGDVDYLTAVSWQEVDYKSFGRKACANCADRLDARTGITVSCEAGFCKMVYHVTCAQKLGLLVDAHSDDPAWPHNNSLLDTNFLYCKKHNLQQLVKSKKDAYAIFLHQENRRMQHFNRPMLTSRQEFKRRNQHQNYLARIKKLESVISLPAMQKKKPKMLHTSSEFLNSFVEKAEHLGIERSQIVESFMEIPTKQIPSIAPTFSSTFVRYVKERDEVSIPEEEKRLNNLKEKKELLLLEQKKLEKCLEMNQSSNKSNASNLNAKMLFDRFSDVICALTGNPKKAPISTKNLTIKTKFVKAPKSSHTSPVLISNNSASKPCLPKLTTPINIVPLESASPSPKKHSPKRPSILARSQAKKLTLNSVLQIQIPHGHMNNLSKKSPASTKPSPRNQKSQKKSFEGSTTLLESPLGDLEPKILAPIRTCYTCNKCSDQSFLIHCEACQHYYHIGCLDPPLKRMPKLMKYSLFKCSDCACPTESSDSESEDKKTGSEMRDEEAEEKKNSSIGTRRKSNLRRS